jgi:uncharacterized protein YndB with AHSA1/START domain
MKQAMKTPIFIKNNITIKAPAAKLWDWLVQPEKTKQYMFGCETVSDWKKGSQLFWKGQYEGKEVIYVEGRIVDIRPGKHLSYTVIDPNATFPHIPENYLTVTYDLEEKNGQTTFKVSQGDYSKVADGEKRYQESYNNGEGWNPILVQIKELVEKS